MFLGMTFGPVSVNRWVVGSSPTPGANLLVFIPDTWVTICS